MNPTYAKIKEWIEAILIAALLALFIRAFVVQAFKIPSGSMLETLQIGDHLLVSRYSYGIKIPFTDVVIIPTGKPERHDIIVFEYPEDPSKDFIKRIIGIPGDTIRIENKELFVNGEKQIEPFAQYVDPYVRNSRRDNLAEFIVPEGKYFVMGDNRDDSRDSRFWGFVEEDAIIGKALFLYWSWDHEHMKPRWNRILDAIH